MINNTGFFLLLIISISVHAQKPSHVFVFLNSKPDKEKISDDAAEELQAKHMASIGQLVEEGKLIVAGPFNGGGGIFVLKTDNTKEANEWLQNDPAIKANRWNVELIPITFLEGGACLTQPPYEMVIYNFARIKYINDIANYKMNTSITELWQDLADQDSLVMIGRFPQSDGGVIAYQGELTKTWLEGECSDQISVSYKELWIAKGSFCEKP